MPQALATAPSRIGNRFRRAARTGNSVEVGQIFRRDDDTGAFIAEIGIADTTTMYVQIFDLPRVELRGEQAEPLLGALRRLDVDVRAIPGGYGGGIASKLAR